MENSNLRQRQRELLIDLRSKIVGAEHTLPFTVYSDDTIEDLLKAQPCTLEELAAVKGFPKDGKRIKGFGEYVCLIFKDTQKVDGVKVLGNFCGTYLVPKMKDMNMF